jgi:uncharacterized protein YkwD
MPPEQVRAWFNRTIIGLAAGVLLFIGALGIITGGSSFFPVFIVPVLLGISGIILIYIEYAVKLWEQNDIIPSIAMVFLPLMFYYFSVLQIYSPELFLVFLAVNSVIFLLLSLLILVCGLRVKWAVRKFVYHRYYYKNSQSPPAKRIPAIIAIFVLFGIILLVNGTTAVITNINSIAGGSGVSGVNTHQVNERSFALPGNVQAGYSEKTPEPSSVRALIFPIFAPGYPGGNEISFFQDLRSGNGQYNVQTPITGPEFPQSGLQAEQVTVTAGPLPVSPEENSGGSPGPALTPVNTPPAVPSPGQSPVQVFLPVVQEVTTIPTPSVTATVLTATMTAQMQEIPVLKIPYPEFEQAVFDRFNTERIERKLIPFGYNALLSGIARAHSVDMADRGYFSRTDPEGKSPTARVMDAGFPVRKTFDEGTYRTGISESIGQVAIANLSSTSLAYQADNLVMEWVKNPGDRNYLMNPDYDLMGVGIASNGSTCFITVDVW